MTNGDLDRIRFVTRHFNDLQGLRLLVPAGLLQIASGMTGGFAKVPRLLPWMLALHVVAMVVACFLIFRAASSYRSYGHVEPQRGAPFVRDPALSIFSPAGPAPRLAVDPPQTHRQLHRFFLPMGAALVLLVSLHAIGPRVELDTDGWTLDPWLQFTPPVVSMMDSGTVAKLSRSPWFRFEETKHVIRLLQTEGMYALLGSSFLGIWLLRGRRLSQAYYLVLALPMLGLAALGASMELVSPPAMFSYVLLALAHSWIAQVLQGSAFLLAGLLDHLQLVRAFGRSPRAPIPEGF
jgi:hypothetical protein